MPCKTLSGLAATTVSFWLASCGGSSGGAPPGPVIGNACNSATIQAASTSVVASAVTPLTTEPAFAALNLTQPLNMLQEPGDDRCWYVLERQGRVLVFENDDAVTTASDFIDLRSDIESGPGEAGLLGMAFHPDYASNGEVFLSFTRDTNGLTSYISRFRSLDEGQTLDPASEEVLLTLAQPFGNHNGGNIAFGPDGYLYIGFGDGGSSNDPGARAQNTLNLFGAMLRIDVDGAPPYAIPSGNPFADNALCAQGFGAADCPEIYAWGLRNPWRWSFDSLTGELWLGDVGQNMFEEIDIIDVGGNYGWPFFEGNRCNTEAPVVDCGFVGIAPVTEHPRGEARSITGGFVYRGAAIPALVGTYVYADFATGNLFQYFDDGNVVTADITPTGLGIASLGQANDGELFLVNFFGGSIERIVAAP